jgi:hypothetical protein
MDNDSFSPPPWAPALAWPYRRLAQRPAGGVDERLRPRRGGAQKIPISKAKTTPLFLTPAGSQWIAVDPANGFVQE